MNVEIKAAVFKQLDISYLLPRTISGLLAIETASIKRLQCGCYHISFENPPRELCHTE